MSRKKEKRREREQTKDEHTLTKIQTQLLAKKEKRREREQTKDEHTLTKIQTQLLAKKQKDGKNIQKRLLFK